MPLMPYKGGLMLILFVVFIICVILYLYSLTFRLLIEKPLDFIVNVPKDLYFYFKRYKNIPKKPFINVYVGLFGQGKTLSAVKDVIDFYHAYNDKIVYDDRVKKYVKQKVLVLSNVDLVGIKYRKFTSLQQIVWIARTRHKTDKRQGVRTITVVLGDEFSVQMNCRSYRESKDSKGNKIQANIDPLFLNALLTSRHSLVHGFYLTSQRFEHMDALLRQVSTNVIVCEKHWRIQKQSFYDAYQMEHCPDPTKLQAKRIEGFFVTDKIYNSYNTLQVVENLAKSCSEGDLISEKEIRDNIALQGRFQSVDKKKKNKRLSK